MAPSHGSSTCTPNLYSFTPVRRRNSTVNNRQGGCDQEQEWSAARCQRLLRALTSRMSILTKEISRYAPSSEVSKGISLVAKVEGNFKLGQRTGGDESWTRTGKKMRRTYSSRGDRGHTNDNERAKHYNLKCSPKTRKPLIPGEVSIPTPVLMRARGERVYSDNISAIGSGPLELDGKECRRLKRSRTSFCAPYMSKGQFHLPGALRDIRHKIPLPRYPIYEGIYHGLEALLRSTANTRPGKETKAPRSLLSMALRSVPRYISDQQNLLRNHVEETGSRSALSFRDISRETYDDLESLGTSGQSWKHLRIVVRCHGVQLLSDAITEGLLDADFCSILITLCLQMSATEEAETLLAALLSSTSFPQPRTVYDNTDQKLSILWKYTKRTGRVDFQYRQLSKLLSSHLLPVSWLATKEFSPIWTGLIQSLMPGAISCDALEFLDISLQLLSQCGIPTLNKDRKILSISTTLSETLKNTFSSLLATLSSMVLLSKATTGQEGPQVSGYNYLANSLRGCLVQSQISNDITKPHEALLLLANLIIGASTLQSPETTSLASKLREKLGRDRGDAFDASTNYHDSTAFIYNVARYCGRAVSTHGFESLGELHLLLEELRCDEDDYDVLKGLIVDSAYIFAKNHPEEIHWKYAADMDAKLSDLSVRSSNKPRHGDSEAGKNKFRWEEGISEWVTATPVVDKPKRKIIRDSLIREHDVGRDTPIQTRPKSRRNIANEILPTFTDLRDQIRGTESNEKDGADSSEGEEGVDASSGASAWNDELVGSASQSEDLSKLYASMSPSDKTFEASFDYSDLARSSQPMISDESRHSIERVPRKRRTANPTSLELSRFDSYATSSSSSTISSVAQLKKNRMYIDRAPRLGRRALQSSLAVTLFDDSDDELSTFVSVPGESDLVMRDISNLTLFGTRNSRSRVKRAKKIDIRVINDSEDELLF